MAGGDEKKKEAAKKAEAKPAELAAEVQKRARGLCGTLNKAFAAERKATVEAARKVLRAALEKKAKTAAKGKDDKAGKDGKDKDAASGKIDEKDFAAKAKAMEANIPVFVATLDSMRVSAAKRGGDFQGWLAIRGWSKTCRSAHMHHAAVHVKITVTRGSKSVPIKLKEEKTYFPNSFKPSDHVYKSSWAIMSRATFEKHWTSGLKTAVLADYSGKTQKYQPKDPWHVELPSEKMKGIPEDKKTAKARPGFADAAVLKCVDYVAEYDALIDVLEDAKEKKKHVKNKSIKKNYKKTYKKKYDAHKRALDAEAKKVAKDAKKKAKMQDEIKKKLRKVKNSMDTSYKETVTLEKEVTITLD